MPNLAEVIEMVNATNQSIADSVRDKTGDAAETAPKVMEEVCKAWNISLDEVVGGFKRAISVTKGHRDPTVWFLLGLFSGIAHQLNKGEEGEDDARDS